MIARAKRDVIQSVRQTNTMLYTLHYQFTIYIRMQDMRKLLKVDSKFFNQKIK